MTFTQSRVTHSTERFIKKATLKSKVHEDNIGLAHANFQVLLKNVGHFNIDNVFGSSAHLFVII